MSFLIRNAEIEIGMDTSGVPYLGESLLTRTEVMTMLSFSWAVCSPCVENHEGNNEVPGNAQSIVSITSAEWEVSDMGFFLSRYEIPHEVSMS